MEIFSDNSFDGRGSTAIFGKIWRCDTLSKQEIMEFDSSTTFQRRLECRF